MSDVLSGAARAERIETLRFRRAGSWLFVLLLLPLVCFLDGEWIAARFAYGQWVANLFVFASFGVMYRAAPPRLRGLMRVGVVVAIGGEVFFSLVLGMYEYRLANVPLYVPPGHALLYAAVYYFVKEPAVRACAHLIGPMFLVLGLAYAAFWLVYAGDAYGAICTLLFGYLIWRYPSSRLFFLTMFLVVAYLEQFGTRFGAWYWPPHLLDRFVFIPSGNPPSGISVFYFGFDAGCLWGYLRRRPELYSRFRQIRAARKRALRLAPG